MFSLIRHGIDFQAAVEVENKLEKYEDEVVLTSLHYCIRTEKAR